MSLMAMINPAGYAVGEHEKKKAAQQARNDQLNSEQKAQDIYKEERDYQRGLEQPFYDLALPAYRQYAEEVTNGKGNPAAQPGWTPTETDAYKYQKAEQDSALNARLSALGRKNSTYNANLFSRADILRFA